MQMPNEDRIVSDYRFGYNGMEVDNEVSGNGNSYTTEFRQYDPRLGRWKSLDPLMKQFPDVSPYCAFDNNPIYFVDPYGLSPGGPGGPVNLSWSGDQKFNDSEFEQNLPKAGTKGDTYTIKLDGAVNPGDRTSVTYKYDDKGWSKSTDFIGNEEGDHWESVEGKTNDSESVVAYMEVPGEINSTVEIDNGISVAGTGTTARANVFIGEESEGKDSELTGLEKGVATGIDIVSWTSAVVGDLNKALIWKGKGFKFKGVKPVSYNLRRSNGTLNGNQHFSGKKYLANSAKYAKKLPIINVGSLGYNTYLAIRTGNNGYFFRGISSFLVGYIPFAGTPMSIYIDTMDPDDFKMVHGDASIRSDGQSVWVSGMCFVAGTKITMSDGSLKNIENVQVGDVVMTFNLANYSLEAQEVNDVISPIHDELVLIELSNGVSNKNTLDHPYYIKGKGWASYSPELTFSNYGIEVKKLEEGDTCLTYYGDDVREEKIIKISIFIEEQITYNLSEVAKNNNFFANGVLVHNKFIEENDFLMEEEELNIQSKDFKDSE